jgi:hypothetical protein
MTEYFWFVAMSIEIGEVISLPKKQLTSLDIIGAVASLTGLDTAFLFTRLDSNSILFCISNCDKLSPGRLAAKTSDPAHPVNADARPFVTYRAGLHFGSVCSSL